MTTQDRRNTLDIDIEIKKIGNSNPGIGLDKKSKSRQVFVLKVFDPVAATLALVPYSNDTNTKV